MNFSLQQKQFIHKFQDFVLLHSTYFIQSRDGIELQNFVSNGNFL